MDHKFIIESFWQKGFNCASVAFFKIALMKFGMNRIIKVLSNGKIIRIQLRNGSRLEFTKKEIDAINKLNRIAFARPRDAKRKKEIKEIRTWVRLCFAVLVRNMEQKGFNGKKYTNATAIAALTNEGISTVYFHSLLGLKRTASIDLTEKNYHRLKRSNAVLLFNEKHIVAASKGMFDKYGKAAIMNETIPMLEKKPAEGWYSLK